MDPAIRDKEFADDLPIGKEQVGRLRDKMHQLQKRPLSHVAFRACNLGKNTDALDAYCRFFGATSGSASKLFDSCGELIPRVRVSNLNKWAENQRQNGFHACVDGDVALAIQFDPTDHTRFRTQCAAKTETDFAACVGIHIGMGALVRKGGAVSVVFHGMVPKDPESPRSPNIFFVRDQDYLSNLIDIGYSSSDRVEAAWYHALKKDLAPAATPVKIIKP